MTPLLTKHWIPSSFRAAVMGVTSDLPEKGWECEESAVLWVQQIFLVMLFCSLSSFCVTGLGWDGALEWQADWYTISSHPDIVSDCREESIKWQLGYKEPKWEIVWAHLYGFSLLETNKAVNHVMWPHLKNMFIPKGHTWRVISHVQMKCDRCEQCVMVTGCHFSLVA